MLVSEQRVDIELGDFREIGGELSEFDERRLEGAHVDRRLTAGAAQHP